MYDTCNTKFQNADPCQISSNTRAHSGYVNEANHHCRLVLLTRIHDVTGSGEEDIILATVPCMFRTSLTEICSKALSQMQLCDPHGGRAKRVLHHRVCATTGQAVQSESVIRFKQILLVCKLSFLP